MTCYLGRLSHRQLDLDFLEELRACAEEWARATPEDQDHEPNASAGDSELSSHAVEGDETIELIDRPSSFRS